MPGHGNSGSATASSGQTGIRPGSWPGGGRDECRGIRIADQQFGLVALHGAHACDTQGGDADSADDVLTSRLGGHAIIMRQITATRRAVAALRSEDSGS
jgi:hypothetical protein